MKTKELRRKSEKELKDSLTGKQQRVGQFKFDLASKKIKNIREIRELRRDIARILTILKEKTYGK